MRLIRSATIRLEEFMDHEIPKYAILSHTWGADEVTFQDMKWLEANEENNLSQKGYDKIQHSCQRALQDGIEYAWVDTCCIDKTSSAELSEAINSMMKWYEHAEICYAYLSDVPQRPFEDSRWFTRGWTLQELLAPARLVFLAHDWSDLSSREKVCNHLSEITGISVSFLEQRPDNVSLRTRLNSASIAERMNWASKRETSRQEDRAYSLLGLFGINMPLLYGEGMGAFLRLQEEIIKRSDDQSLFAWTEENVNLGHYCVSKIESKSGPETGPENGSEHQALSQPKFSSFDTFKPSNPQDLLTCGFLAESPAAFLHCGNYIPCSVGGQTPPFSITNKGLSMQVPLLSCKDHSFVLIPCQTKKDSTILLTIPLK
ncbi:hypothetical protein N7520_005414 [Penicillium odoratum]|uniref:uncharacterized protein n=1 Tax=Penicillium odoratum TaxID=1167516 RepID=UPI0025482270|nr:uncharacterized protein N7520_005414 [Penicillium odoratum]KAJ5765855.1 hypothetical protein N7520_005414 [Penicillium odoratum]